MRLRLGEIDSQETFYISTVPFDFIEGGACLAQHVRANATRAGLKADIGVVIHAFDHAIVLQINEELSSELLKCRSSKADGIGHAALCRHTVVCVARR